MPVFTYRAEGRAEMSSEGFGSVSAPHCVCTPPGPGSWAWVGARRQGLEGDYVLGAQAVHLWVACLGCSSQPWPGEAGPRPPLGGKHPMAPDGSEAQAAVGVTQLYWMNRWPSEWDGKELLDYRNKPWAQPGFNGCSSRAQTFIKDLLRAALSLSSTV